MPSESAPWIPAPTNVTPLAPEPSRSTVTTIPALERWVGRVTAAAAAAILEALSEFQDRGVSPATKDQIKERFWCLYRVRQLLVPVVDFDFLAREQGERVLRAADVSPRLARKSLLEYLRQGFLFHAGNHARGRKLAEQRDGGRCKVAKRSTRAARGNDFGSEAARFFGFSITKRWTTRPGSSADTGGPGLLFDEG
jgi:hypothetical protein